MAQPATKVDTLQIEPGSTGTRTISRSTASATLGNLKFIDPAVPSGYVLSQLAGLHTYTGVLTVGKGGGAQYTVIQDALNAVPDAGTVPYVVLVFPGEYTENLLVQKTNLTLCGMGQVTITNSAASPTLWVQQSATCIPENVTLQNLTLIQTGVGEDVVFVDGSNTIATGTITAVTAPLIAGDSLTIAGLPLTGVGAARTAGGDNFNALTGTVSAMATEIAAAINDTENSFAASVTAVAVGAVVTLTAVTPGTAGNAVTLAVSTTPSGGLTRSGANLTGGGGVSSLVGSEQVLIKDCVLNATGVGGRPVHADTVNNVVVRGGTWFGSASTANCVVTQTAKFQITGTEWVSNLEVGYNSGDPEPSAGTSEWSVQHCTRVGDVLVNLIGKGSTSLQHLSSCGDVTHGGNRTLLVTDSNITDVVLQDTVAATFRRVTTGTVGSAVGNTLSELVVSGYLVFVATNTGAVTFNCAMPDAIYTVSLDIPVAGVTGQVTARTATGFTITLSGVITDTVYWAINRV